MEHQFKKTCERERGHEKVHNQNNGWKLVKYYYTAYARTAGRYTFKLMGLYRQPDHKNNNEKGLVVLAVIVVFIVLGVIVSLIK